MITTILVNHIRPSESKTVSNNEIGMLLFNKNLHNYSIIIRNCDVMNFISPHEIDGGVYEIQRTIDLLTKPIVSREEITITSAHEHDTASFTITDIIPEHEKESNLKDFDFDEFDFDDAYRSLR